MRLRPTVARYIVASDRPPQLTETILLAEKVHAALVSLSNASRIFTGCDEQGKPLQGNRHAHVFCESNNAFGKGIGGEITNLIIYDPAGFEPHDQKALNDLSEISIIEDIEINVTLLCLGKPQDFGGHDLERAQCPLLAASRVWVSRTPFVPTRHPKITRAGVPKLDASGSQIGSPRHELLRLLRLEGFAEPVSVDPVAGTQLAGRAVPWQEFRCWRNNGNGRRAAYDRGYGFRIEFPEMVQGPMAIGYGAHFGLGGFSCK